MTIPKQEQTKIQRYLDVAETFIGKLYTPVPWLRVAGPTTWQLRGKAPDPVYLFELDPKKVSASRLVANTNLTHDIATALGGSVRVYFLNSVGIGLIFDERKPKEFPSLIPLPLTPPGEPYD